MSFFDLEENIFTYIERGLCGTSSFFITFLFSLFFFGKKGSFSWENIDKMDKIILINAYIQTIFLSIYFFLHEGLFILTTIRSLRIIQDLLLFMVLSYMSFGDALQERLYQAALAMFAILVVFWYFTGILQKTIFHYNCTRIFWCVYSGITFSLNFINFGLGIISLKKCEDIFVKELDDKTNEAEHILKKKFELKNKKIQLYSLMIVGLASGFIQFIWDMMAHKVDKLEMCKTFYFAFNLKNMMVMFTLKLVTLIMPPFLVYYVFYWRNKVQVDFLACDRSLSILCDYRNEEGEDENQKEMHGN